VIVKKQACFKTVSLKNHQQVNFEDIFLKFKILTSSWVNKAGFVAVGLAKLANIAQTAV
jgi:hypothetical protein